MNRDGANESLWQNETNNFEAVKADFENKIFDVLIIGGGITGISTALKLQQAGKKCILAEAETLGFGTTSGTTAHLNNFFDTPYNKIVKDFSLENAKLLATAASDAIKSIQNNVKEFSSDCDFEEKDGYLFAINDKQTRELEDIADATNKVGVPIDFINHSPFPVPYLKVARIQGQAQFNPVSYIFSLAKAFENLGGIILQNCRVDEVIDGETAASKSDLGTIKSTNVIYATHIPPGVNMLHFRCAPYRSYAIAVKLRNDNYPAAVGYDMCDPYRYYRTQEINGEKYLIAGGEDHKTGHEEFTNAPIHDWNLM